jgi:hypothetical protein
VYRQRGSKLPGWRQVWGVELIENCQPHGSATGASFGLRYSLGQIIPEKAIEMTLKAFIWARRAPKYNAASRLRERDT